MTFQKGTSGNPRGRPKKGAALTEYIRAQLEQPYREGERRTNKQRIAEVVVAQAAKGNLMALQFIVERTEGKAPQRIEHSGPEGGPMEQRHEFQITAVDYRIAAAPILTDATEREEGGE